MERIKSFKRADFSKVFTEAKIAFDPKDGLGLMKKTAVNHLESFIPALNKLYPKLDETPSSLEVTKVPKDVESKVSDIIAKAQAAAEKIIADAQDLAQQTNEAISAPKAKPKLTKKQLDQVVMVIAKKKWSCEMGSSLNSKGTKIECEKGDELNLPRWMAIALAGQNVV